MFKSFWKWIVAQFVAPDPWEPPHPLKAGQLLLRKMGDGDDLFNPGESIAVVNSVEEARQKAAELGIARWYLTNAAGDSADDRSPERLFTCVSYRALPPELSVPEVEAILKRAA